MNPETNIKNNTPLDKPKERVPIKSLRTFQGDVQEAISKNNFTTTTILVSEQKRKLEKPADSEELKNIESRNSNFIVIGVFLIVFGIVSISALYYLKSREKVIVEQQTKSLMAFNKEEILTLESLDRSDFIEEFINKKTSWSSAVNTVLFINPQLNSKNISSAEIFQTLTPNMPPSLIRSFGDKYMFGVYSFDNNETFIIITVDDYSLAYPGMLKWENDMQKDIGTLFEAEKTNSSSTPVFIDISLKNRDMRVLKDSGGKSLMLYSFLDKKTLVITKNENLLSAIADKIIISKQIR